MGRYEAFTTIIHWRITVILLILFIISWNTVCTKPMLANINHQFARFFENTVKTESLELTISKRMGKQYGASFIMTVLSASL